MKKVVMVMLVVVVLLVVAACGEDVGSGLAPINLAGCDTTALAGFLEINGNELNITPVEVFMLYSAESGSNFFEDSALSPIVFIEENDVQKLADYGLEPDDFWGWAHIRPNWHSVYGWQYVEQADIQTLSFEIDANTEFVFMDSQRNVTSTNSLDDFLPYFFPTVVHFVEVYNGRVIRIVQEFGFTM